MRHYPVLFSIALFLIPGCAASPEPPKSPSQVVVVIPKVASPSGRVRSPGIYRRVPPYDRYVQLEPMILEYLRIAERQQALSLASPIDGLSKPLAKQACEDIRNELMLMAIEDSVMHINALLVSGQGGTSILRSLAGEPVSPDDISRQIDLYREHVRKLRLHGEAMKAKRLAVFACLLLTPSPRRIP